MTWTRDRAFALMQQYTTSESLRKHMYAVEIAMRAMAEAAGEDPDAWGIVGLLHDFDYERWPNPPDHTREGAKILRDRRLDAEIVEAILSHADWNQDDYPRDRPIRKALFAVDELCGLITATALVRPGRLDGMTPKSIRKKMKTSAFAASVNRDDIVKGAELLEIELNDHIANCIAAMQGVAGELGLAD